MTDTFFVANDIQELNFADKVLFKTANEFSQFITTMAQSNETSLTQTILAYCEERDIDPESIAKLISRPLKDLLAIEMQEAGLLAKPSTGTLDV